MLICKFYNKEKGIEKCWYQSSNILYSECNDKEFTLKIVFKQGRTYLYHDIDINEYLLFRTGVGKELSQGLAFGKFIKKLKNERIDDSDLSKIEEEKNVLLQNVKG